MPTMPGLRWRNTLPIEPNLASRSKAAKRSLRTTNGHSWGLQKNFAYRSFDYKTDDRRFEKRLHGIELWQRTGATVDDGGA